ncbi:MAG TPA: hypothetical protein VJQ59_18935 [Candidatus Sulfotelmatobacter sp.]|nr:hypothetical protein [Candidatus Sulfotelmatobacter sp.]
MALDDTIDPILTGDPPLDDLLAHDRWFCESCEHGGYIVSEPLGNMAVIAHVREVIGNIEQSHFLYVPLLKEKVIFNGVHSGDHIPSADALHLLEEVDTMLQFSGSLDDSDRKFFLSVKRLCKASINTKNPIVF